MPRFDAVGSWVGPGLVIIKVSKPHQDLRFDVPTVGPETIREMRAVEARVLAVEAEKTLMVDKPTVVRQADAAGLCVVAVSVTKTDTGFRVSQGERE